MTETQEATIKAIVNVFETGKATGDYANVTLIPGDTGGLTYGRSQTTINSGNLYTLVKAYCDAKDPQNENKPGEFSVRLAAFLPGLKSKSPALSQRNDDSATQLRRLLMLAGSTPLMQRIQDEFFDAVYWAPALDRAKKAGITTPLGIAVIYDSTIHGSWGLIRDKTNSLYGKLGAPGSKIINEKHWIRSYVDTRREWLANHKNAVLHTTVYRMDTFIRLFEAKNWELTLPVVAHGVKITPEIIAHNIEK